MWEVRKYLCDGTDLCTEGSSSLENDLALYDGYGCDDALCLHGVDLAPQHTMKVALHGLRVQDCFTIFCMVITWSR